MLRECLQLSCSHSHALTRLSSSSCYMCGRKAVFLLEPWTSWAAYAWEPGKRREGEAGSVMWLVAKKSVRTTSRAHVPLSLLFFWRYVTAAFVGAATKRAVLPSSSTRTCEELHGWSGWRRTGYKTAANGKLCMDSDSCCRVENKRMSARKEKVKDVA